MMDSLPLLPPRNPEAHKGSFGRVLLIGGSRNMPGAIALSGMGALRSGAGLVSVATAQSCQATVAGFEPCYMTRGLPDNPRGELLFPGPRKLEELTRAADVVAVGPGLGQGRGQRHLVGWLYQHLHQPLVVDADGLNALAQLPQLPPASGPRVLTPHPGEFRRLLGQPIGERPAAVAHAQRYASREGVVLLLKGAPTAINAHGRTWFNATGNPGMATGGTGDVLTGVLAGLLAQGMAPVDAARLAAHLHGLAGDLAASVKGEVSLIARDLLAFLPEAFRQVHSP